jgi:hypothetical protein
MRLSRSTNNGIKYTPEYIQSRELRSDRMNADPTRVYLNSGGPLTSELSYPVDMSPESDFVELALCAPWSKTPFRDNDGVADSVITDISAGGVVTVTTGPAFVAGHLVQFSGFTLASNNGVFLCTTGSATVPAFAGAGLTAQPVPPATARMKVVGFRGAAGDITATATGLASTVLNFTTLGLQVGQSVKIGDLTDANTFAFLVTAGAAKRRDAWGRITAITATGLTLDNLTSGWAVDAGTGKTITVFFGDTIKNGVQRYAGTFEEGFMDHTNPSPTYLRFNGQAINTAKWTFTVREQAMSEYTFIGMAGSSSLTTLDAVPDPATTTRAMAAGVNMNRISENGTCIANPNFLQSLEININNNLRQIDALKCGEDVGPSTINWGSCDVTVSAPVYFGDRNMLAKLDDGTPTNMYSVNRKDNQALIFSLPRLTLTGDSPSSGAKNTDTMLTISAMGSLDLLTNAQIVIDRFDYWA